LSALYDARSINKLNNNNNEDNLCTAPKSKK